MKNIDQKKASRTLKIQACALAFIGWIFSIWRGILEAKSDPLVFGLGGLFLPFFFILIMQLFERFRNQHSRYKIFCYVTIFLMVGNVITITQESSHPRIEKQRQVQNYIYELKPQLPYNIPSNGFSISEVFSKNGDDIGISVITPHLKSDFEEGGEVIFLDHHFKYFVSNYCSKKTYELLRTLNILYSIYYYDLENELIGVNTINSEQCN